MFKSKYADPCAEVYKIICREGDVSLYYIAAELDMDISRIGKIVAQLRLQAKIYISSYTKSFNKGPYIRQFSKREGYEPDAIPPKPLSVKERQYNYKRRKNPYMQLFNSKRG